MTTASRQPFVLPLQLGVLDHFVHPQEGHRFERPVWHEGQALVANSYIALRVDRGYWFETDFQAPPWGFLESFLGLPWSDLSQVPASHWRALDEVRGPLFQRGAIGPWLEVQGKWRCSPSPVVRVGAYFLARLSHLQLIARLPRCEVVPPGVEAAPLRFRFTGGSGLLMQGKRLTEASFSIFAPQRCPIDGGSIPRNTGPLVLPKKPPYWKQFEPTD